MVVLVDAMKLCAANAPRAAGTAPLSDDEEDSGVSARESLSPTPMSMAPPPIVPTPELLESLRSYAIDTSESAVRALGSLALVDDHLPWPARRALLALKAVTAVCGGCSSGVLQTFLEALLKR